MKSLFIFIILGCLALASSSQIIDAAGSAVNGVTWTSVPTSPPASTNYNVDTVGSCMCDLTAGLCDANCCCDPDCNGLTASFSGCVQEKASSGQKLRCIPQNDATAIVYQRDGTYETRRYFGSDSVCIVDTNRVDNAEFFNAPDAAAQASISSPTSTWPASTQTTVNFKEGNLLPIVYAIASGTTATLSVPPSSKYLRDFGASLPSSANCDRDAQLGFLHNAETHSCFLSGSTLAAQCASGGNLDVAQFRYLAFAGPDHSLASINSVVPLTIRFINDDTEAVMETVDGKPAFDKAFDPASTSTVPTATVVTSFNGTACLNGVAGTRLSVLYQQVDGITSISKATLVVRVKPVRGVDANNMYLVSSASRFTPSATAFAVSNDAPIATEVSKPGNPGYLRGRRILAGYNLDNTDGRSAVMTLPRGFEIPLGGSCSSGRVASVPFLHNISSASCTLSITETELQNFCSTGTLTQLAAFLAPTNCGGAACPTNISSFIDRLGRDADASGTDSNDWVSVMGLPITNPTGLVYDSIRKQCSGLVTGLEWTIGVARLGVGYNPQDTIISAKVQPTLGTWTYNAASSGLVRFSFKVTFVRLMGGDLSTRKRVVPPNVFPTVDQDIFYPFRRPGA